MQQWADADPASLFAAVFLVASAREHAVQYAKDGELETGAGKVLIHRIPDVTAGYNPEPLFQNGHKILA